MLGRSEMGLPTGVLGRKALRGFPILALWPDASSLGPSLCSGEAARNDAWKRRLDL